MITISSGYHKGTIIDYAVNIWGDYIFLVALNNDKRTFEEDTLYEECNPLESKKQI